MMFALGIRYLNGWAMATHPADRDRAEWPPHPDRVFMALAAAHFETDGDADERNALEWLQSLPAPALVANENYSLREIVTSYVPVNDTEISRSKNDTQAALNKRLSKISAVSTLAAARGAGLALLPENRSRQPRQFPVAIPFHDEDMEAETSMPRVYLIWNDDLPVKRQRPLTNLCAKVTSIGHSASFVQMWIEPEPPPANLVPVDGVAVRHRLRIPGDARLAHLESRYMAGLRPVASLWQGYGPPKASPDGTPPPESVFDNNLLIFRRDAGPRLGLESTLQLTAALRDTVMSHCTTQPPPEWVSGHKVDGSRSERPHLAFIPLPHVGSEHADGHLLGVAIAIPRRISGDEQRCLGKLLFDEATGQPREIDLRMGRLGAWKVMLDEGDDSRVSLQSETWTAGREGATRWATVTPIVFDRHPKRPGDAEDIIATSCERIGLPRPSDVIPVPVSMFIGVPHARRFPLVQRKNGVSFHHAHAILTFDQPVIGPVMLGAGRFRGYGLCRPLRAGDET